MLLEFSLGKLACEVFQCNHQDIQNNKYGYYQYILIISTYHWLRIITRLSGSSPDTLYKNRIQNPSQIFYNVSGESGYDSNSKPMISIASTNTLKPNSTVPVHGIKYGTYTTGRNKYNMDQHGTNYILTNKHCE